MLNNQEIATGTYDDFKCNAFLASDSIASPNFGEKCFSNSASLSHEADSHESSEIFSDLVLDFISEMLMEEEMDEMLDVLQTHPDLEATERPFYEIIGEKYPPSPDRPPLHSSPSSDSSDSHRSHFYNINCTESSINAVYDDDDLLYMDGLPTLFFEDLSASQFETELKETELIIPSAAVRFDPAQEHETRHKSRHHDDGDIEDQRKSKQSAVSFEEPPFSSEMLDMVLLCTDEKFPKVISTIRETIQNEAGIKNISETKKKKSVKKKQPKKNVIDFQTLLMDCAQMVASGDHKRSHESLRQIRHHCSPHGDASQRVAHYFCNALEARLAGTGSEIYHAMVSKRRSLNDVLKAYQLYLSACPFKQVTYYFSNHTILDAIESATRVHIIDLGSFLGFQWPAFLKMLSARAGGPPKLRITAVDKPMPGFRPTEMIEETGRRLAGYAERFGVPFEFQAVASKLDEVRVEELRLREEEMLVVNCLFQTNTLADETMGVDCSRDKFLRKIRNLNPALFVCATGSGSYGAPFFVTRFREALYHFSAIFDMMEMTAPRENVQRMLVERDLYGKFAINVISCEGAERVDWPETYKQSQVRFLRAGLQQLGINKKKYVDMVKCAVRDCYHKDFSVDVDGRWLLQGWRGRIFIALSSWKPR